jgi:hypothetical protein
VVRRILAAGAALGLCLSGPAMAAQPHAPTCLTSAEMHGMVAYFLPTVLDKVAAGCAAHLPAGSYLINGTSGLRGSLARDREAAWPMARAAFFKFSKPEDVKTLASLSNRALRPLVDDMLEQKMAIPVSHAICGEVNDIAQALAPLDPMQTVHLIATILAAAARNDSKLRSCPRGAA